MIVAILRACLRRCTRTIGAYAGFSAAAERCVIPLSQGLPMRCCLLLLSFLPAAVLAGVPAELAGTPQADGVSHTLRQIPEACVRVEGRFTGQAGTPYAVAVVPLGGTCQPRARFAGAAATGPEGAGWRVQQRITVPSARCPALAATVVVWERDGDPAPARDGQGRARIYLEEARRQAGAGQLARLPAHAVQWQVAGRCPG